MPNWERHTDKFDKMPFDDHLFDMQKACYDPVINSVMKSIQHQQYKLLEDALAKHGEPLFLCRDTINPKLSGERQGIYDNYFLENDYGRIRVLTIITKYLPLPFDSFENYKLGFEIVTEYY